MAKIDYQFDYEDIFANQDAEDEKYFSENGLPIRALRLYNFKTDVAQLIDNHKVGIYNHIYMPMRSQTDYWINLVGYASKIGNRSHNMNLSLQRCAEVQKEIVTGKNRLYVAEFRKTVARGSDASPDNPGDDFGYWRSVKIYVHKGAPPPPLPAPKPPVSRLVTQRFALKMMGGQSLSLFKFLGRDEYVFQIKDVDSGAVRCFLYRGTSVSVGLPGMPVSISGSSDWVPFSTISHFALTVDDFNNVMMGVGQEPGISAGSTSVRGLFYIDFGRMVDSQQFVVRETEIVPPILVLSADTGAGISGSFGKSNGRLRMVTCPKDPTVPDWA
ncbi:hypothetical protein [Dyadobacter sandarakinus]|uniref:OmpA family protein n=1 Tax=Dyadobacter sandarakinus TaxID=2747268 RepID=A0ABX7IA81_9BACT|nr:hypothetical protein [Dyadobacter sandarakinus]QRR03009.1 hypothetical protein HWI92_19890 [Dyadobacter sandarakinus]